MQAEAIPSFRLSAVQAALAKQALDSIARGGLLRPEAVVEAARPKSSPLHQYFTWSDTAAAEKCRLTEAAVLIRSVKVQIAMADRRTAQVRAFVSVRGCDGKIAGQRGYIPVVKALSSQSYREQMLTEARGQLEAFRRKYAVLEELTGVMAAIEEALNRGEAA